MNFESWYQSAHPAISLSSMQAVLALASEGATVPFIARYRKERTGSLDEVAIRSILDFKEKWDQIETRKQFILGEIEKQNKLTPELRETILQTYKAEILEDLYLPYKIKRKTKAALAKEAGLQPLADWIWNCGHGTETPQPGQTLEIWAFTFRNEAKEIKDAEDAIAGAQDILIERMSESQELRQHVRDTVFNTAVIKTGKGKKPKANSKFENYFSYQESIQSLLLPQNSHRYLAIRRGWIEEELSLNVEGPADQADFEKDLITAFEVAACTVNDSPGAEVLKKAARLAYKAHVFTSIENEVHKALREVADDAAINVFSENLRKLLLASPYGAHSVLGVDPGIRTGCKLAVVDNSGKYIASAVIFLNSEEEKAKTNKLLAEVVKLGSLSAIAIGNGTGGRETETFIRHVMKEHEMDVPVVMVNEAGASVYSASEAAREEFPDIDLTVRGAISIARRLQDPLAELVKVEPKSIGVGQYQHDVSPHSLKKSLTEAVESCVNQVGVNLNTASYHLLSYVSGIGETLAKSIVSFRQSNGLFKSRSDLMEVGRFSKKVFEQAAGFLRIPDGPFPLDNTGVHPENYPKLELFAKKNGKGVTELLGAGVALLKSDPSFKEEVGPFTFADIIQELEKPGRDPRDVFVPFQFRDDIFEVKDLTPGMVCPGIVTNVTNFGAFVDIGVHQDGLVHISQLSDKFIKDPREVVSPNDRVKVRILEVNTEKNQISLSMKNVIEKPKAEAAKIKPREVKRRELKPSAEPSKLIQPNTGPRPERVARAGAGRRPDHAPRKPKEAFNNPFGGLASLRDQLKPKTKS